MGDEEEGVKDTDDEDADNDAADDEDADDDASYNSADTMTAGANQPEIADVHTKRLWKSVYLFFCSNIPGQKFGYRKFPFHLAAYLYFRNRSGKRGEFNPTQQSKYEISYFDKHQDSDLQRFVMTKLGMSGSDFHKFKHGGKVMCFKRCLKIKHSGGKQLPYDEHYGRCKEKLGITGF